MVFGCPIEDAYGTLKKKKNKPSNKNDDYFTNIYDNDVSINVDKPSINDKKSGDSLYVNEVNNKLNNNIENILKEMNHKIISLQNDLNSFKDSNTKIINKTLDISNHKEGFTNNGISTSINNCNINELILYIFTGIFILICMDYMYKLGKKTY